MQILYKVNKMTTIAQRWTKQRLSKAQPFTILQHYILKQFLSVTELVQKFEINADSLKHNTTEFATKRKTFTDTNKLYFDVLLLINCFLISCKILILQEILINRNL